MKRSIEQKDLIVLVADRDIQKVMEGLLHRSGTLRFRQPTFDIEIHHCHDHGCRTRSVEQLRPFLNRYRYALIVFDRHGSGSEETREKIQKTVERNLSRNGWPNCAKAIVIDPEIETWVWSKSSNVCRVLGWKKSYEKLREFLETGGFWPETSLKPPKPKEAMLKILRVGRVRRSSEIFFQLASTVNPRYCQDSAFKELLQTLREWFPPEPRTARRRPKR